MGGGTSSGGGSDGGNHANNPAASAPSPPSESPSDGGFSERELQQMEALLEETVGNLVVFPTRFLETEDRLRDFLFPLDVIQPIAIFA